MGLTFALFAAVGARLVYLHCFLNEDVIGRLLSGQQVIVPIASSRGTVYDRNMREIATTVTAQSLHATPSDIQSPAAVAEQIAPIIGVDESDLVRLLGVKKPFVWLARQLDPAVADRIRDLDIDGLDFISEPRRYYPKSSLVAHLVGITGIDGQGLEGLELRYDEVLRGEDGYMATLRDAKGRALIPLLDEHKEPTGGRHIVLTVDEDIQHTVQEALRRACEQYHPRRGMVVVENPRTGEILAVANWPEFDPNDFSRSTADVRRNAAFVDLFEPGSVFKVVTAVGALEERVVEPYEEIDCHNGRLRYCGDIISDVHPMEIAPFVDVVVQSSNIGTIEVAARLGPEMFNRYMRRMGFGKPVGIGFPGEPRGILRPLERWSRRSMGALPIGQEIAVTTLQLAQVFSAIANDGIMMRPKVVREVLARDGSVLEQLAPETVCSICSPRVARLNTEILCGVVERGTGTRAAVEGYRVAGKTGTAEIALPEGGGYSRDRHMTVFAGFAPADAPALTIVVVLDSPQTEPRLDTGGRVAAPVFQEVARHSLRIVGIPPRPAESDDIVVACDRRAPEPVATIDVPVKKVEQRGSAMARRARVRMSLSVVNGSGYAEGLLPEADSTVPVIARQEGIYHSDKPLG